MRKITTILIVLFSSYALADTTTDYLQTKLNAIRTMSASFKQIVTVKKRQLSQSTGTMALARPGRFRWQTVSPMSQLVVADGAKLWVYDKELEQVSVKKQHLGMEGAAALFLSGKNDTLARDFKVTSEQSDGQKRFDLRSKSNKVNFLRVALTFNGDKLIAMTLFDQLGQTTKVAFNHIKNNPKLSPSLFQFKVPKGVDVVQQ